MRKSWRDLEKDHDALAVRVDTHVADSDKKSSDLEKKVGLLDVHMTGEVGELRKDFKEFRDDAQPVIDFFKTLGVLVSWLNKGGRGVLKVLAAITVVITILVGLKTLGVNFW